MNLAISHSVFVVGGQVLPVSGGTILQARCTSKDLNLPETSSAISSWTDYIFLFRFCYLQQNMTRMSQTPMEQNIPQIFRLIPSHLFPFIKAGDTQLKPSGPDFIL